MFNKPRFSDSILLSLFVILITYHPFYLTGEINLFETGLYLPGINAILHGQVPFRDFFHLRGAFELYMPALVMKVFGTSFAVLATYFYAGSVLTLIVCVLIGGEIFQTRIMFYLMTLVLVARTFPRVTFTYWGGMRYAWGVLAVWCAVKFFKRDKSSYIFWAGIFTSLALLTSIEVGICALTAVLGALLFSMLTQKQDRSSLVGAGVNFSFGFLSIIGPYVIYLLATGSFFPCIDTIIASVTKNGELNNLHYISTIPKNPLEAFLAMINPGSKNFRHLTPAYLYLFLAGYFILQFKNRKVSTNSICVVCLGLYGWVMYVTAFRAIWASQFEMALQPEKILLFFLLECFILLVLVQRGQIETGLKAAATPDSKEYQQQNRIYWAIKICLALFFISTIAYPIQRFNHRFFVFKYLRNLVLGKSIEELKPLAGKETRRLEVKRAQGMTVPISQAEDFEKLSRTIEDNTAPQDPVFMYPELGAFSFLVDRPFIGRFPMATFSWYFDSWHRELMDSLRMAPPLMAVLDKSPGPWFEQVYFQSPKNREHYEEVQNFIKGNYRLIEETPKLTIYRLKNVNPRAP